MKRTNYKNLLFGRTSYGLLYLQAEISVAFVNSKEKYIFSFNVNVGSDSLPYKKTELTILPIIHFL